MHTNTVKIVSGLSTGHLTFGATYPKLTSPSCHQNAKHHLQSPITNLQLPIYFQLRYLHKLFTIQPNCSARSSSVLALSQPQSLSISSSPSKPYPTMHHISLKQSPSEFQIFLATPSSLSVTHHHFPQTPLSITPGACDSKLKSHIFKTRIHIRLI